MDEQWHISLDTILVERIKLINFSVRLSSQLYNIIKFLYAIMLLNISVSCINLHETENRIMLVSHVWVISDPQNVVIKGVSANLTKPQCDQEPRRMTQLNISSDFGVVCDVVVPSAILTSKEAGRHSGTEEVRSKKFSLKRQDFISMRTWAGRPICRCVLATGKHHNHRPGYPDSTLAVWLCATPTFRGVAK